LYRKKTILRTTGNSCPIACLDPRRTATCEQADPHLPIKAGTDVWLFNGLLNYLAQQGRIDSRFVAAHTNGLDDALAAAAADCSDPTNVAKICKVDQ
jgi:assimilatory nitrate reductase catalytic subunit